MKVPTLKWIPPIALAGTLLTSAGPASAGNAIGIRCYPDYVPASSPDSGAYTLFTAFTSQDIYPICRAVYQGTSATGEPTILVVNLDDKNKPVAGSQRQIGPSSAKAGYAQKLVKVNLTEEGLGVQLAAGDRYGVIMWLDINNQIVAQRPTLATGKNQPLSFATE